MIAEEREHFEREYGCTEREWRSWMPGAMGGHELLPEGAQALRAVIGSGQLRLEWSVLPARVIALVRVPRLQVSFAFDGVALAERRKFLRRFDMHLQRGGG